MKANELNQFLPSWQNEQDFLCNCQGVKQLVDILPVQFKMNHYNYLNV